MAISDPRQWCLSNIPNCLKELFLDFDIELGTLTTFYSRTHPERGNLLCNEEIVEQTSERETQVVSRIVLGGSRGDSAHLLITDTLKVEPDSLRRTVGCEVLERSVIRDIAVRYVLNAPLIRHVTINGKSYKHRSANKYYQFQTNFADLHLADKKVRIGSAGSMLGVIAGRKIGKYIYFRDEPEGDYRPAPWILHSRFLVRNPDVFSFRGCLHCFNKPFPTVLDATLQRLGLHRIFLDCRERFCGYLPFQANGAAIIEKNAIFKVKDQWTWT